MNNGKPEIALPVTPLETRGWCSDGFVGSSTQPGVVPQLIKHAIEDLEKIDSRVFIVFDEVPGLQPAGLLHLLEVRGNSLPIKLDLQPLEDNEESAKLLRACQVDSQDFEEIPSCEDSLDPYRGYGSEMWRKWEDKGVLLINCIDEITNHLAFVGLKPEYRNKGIGKQMVAAALSMTGRDKKLTTAVDSRNVSACKMYRKLGFKITEVRKIFFKDFTVNNKSCAEPIQ